VLGAQLPVGKASRAGEADVSVGERDIDPFEHFRMTLAVPAAAGAQLHTRLPWSRTWTLFRVHYRSDRPEARGSFGDSGRRMLERCLWPAQCTLAKPELRRRRRRGMPDETAAGWIRSWAMVGRSESLRRPCAMGRCPLHPGRSRIHFAFGESISTLGCAACTTSSDCSGQRLRKEAALNERVLNLAPEEGPQPNAGPRWRDERPR